MIQPMLAEKAREPFDSPAHLYEVKYDGARCVAYVGNGNVKLLARSGTDHTATFPELQGIHRQLNATEVVLDGELVVEAGDGTHNFQALQSRVHRMKPLAVRVAAQTFPATYLVFDVLRVNGVELTANGQRVPLEARKALLSRLLDPSQRCRIVEHVEGEGVAFFQECIRQGMEGVMAKDRQGLYHPGRRHSAWLKVKGVQEDSFVVCGYTAGEGWREGLFGALLLGKPDGKGGMRYCGSVGTGFTVVGLATVRTYAATEDTRPVLNAVLMKLGRTVELVAADGFRLAVKTITSPFPTPDDSELSIIVPLAVVAALLRTWALTPHNSSIGPDAMKDIARVVAQRRPLVLSRDGEGNLGFAFDGTEVVAREIQGTFPNYGTLIPRDQPHEVIVSGGAFYGAVRQLRDLTEDGSGIVRLEWEGDQLTVSARALEIGQASITIPLFTPVATPGRVAVNPRYLLEASGQALEGILTIRASEPSNPIVVEATGTPTLVVMPMFVRWGDEPEEPAEETGETEPEGEEEVAAR